MGSAIAGRFVEAGFDVIAWNRSPEALAALVDAGARAASSPSEVLAAPVSFSMLANDDAVDAVLTAENFDGPEGRLHVCLSSIALLPLIESRQRVAATRSATFQHQFWDDRKLPRRASSTSWWRDPLTTLPVSISCWLSSERGSGGWVNLRASQTS